MTKQEMIDKVKNRVRERIHSMPEKYKSTDDYILAFGVGTWFEEILGLLAEILEKVT